MILAIDPGTKDSGWCLYDGTVRASGVEQNEGVLILIREHWDVPIAIERFEARGMAVGEDSLATVRWAGRFQQWARNPEVVILVKRSAVKLHLCGSCRAKDPNVRQALIDKLGPPGTKKQPGPTFGVTSHAWAALAVAVTALETNPTEANA